MGLNDYDRALGYLRSEYTRAANMCWRYNAFTGFAFPKTLPIAQVRHRVAYNHFHRFRHRRHPEPLRVLTCLMNLGSRKEGELDSDINKQQYK